MPGEVGVGRWSLDALQIVMFHRRRPAGVPHKLTVETASREGRGRLGERLQWSLALSPGFIIWLGAVTLESTGGFFAIREALLTRAALGGRGEMFSPPVFSR